MLQRVAANCPPAPHDDVLAPADVIVLGPIIPASAPNRNKVAFDAGMERTVAWFVEHEEWWRPLKSGEFWEFYQRNYKPVQTG